MASSPLTVDQFAASIKAKYPQYASIPDAQLVEKVVAKYPQYKSSIGGAPPSAPSKPSELTAPDPFPTRVLDRVSQNMQGMADFPGAALRDARQRYLARHPQGSSVDPVTGAYDAARSSIEAVVNPMAESAASLTPPGIAERLSKKEDPAKLAGDALMMLTPGTEELGRATHTVGDATKAGSVFGAKTRAIQMMDHLDQVAKDVPVDYAPAYQWAKKAMALEAYGYQVPAPIKAYVAMVESRLKGGAEGMGGGAFMDRAGSTHPLTYQDARNFEASLGAKIDWDDPGGKMNALQKKMRESLGDSTSSALQPYGLDTLYKRAKSEFTKAYGAKERWGPFGYFGGKVAAYASGVPHSWMVSHITGKVGRDITESLADRVVNAGKERPRATPRASAGPSPAEIEANTRRMMEVWKRGKEQAAARGISPRSVEADALRAIEDRAWQESVFGHRTSSEPDIGAKVRAKNPEPTRAETYEARRRAQRQREEGKQ